jgi:asparagine synthase (glutamine-hydrolysing)
MCGIAGSFSARPLTDSREPILMEQLQAILHRGPDAQTCWLDKARGVALGHTRLSINDLEHGCQPIHSLDKRFVSTVNGEFYDFKRHRSLLMAEGQRFATKSDSEIAHGLYRKHGLDFIKHLRGEFAFVLYDRETDELLLIRDRWGVRPLFIHVQDGHTIHWGSEVKALLAHPEIPAKLDPKAALHQLMQTIAPGMSAFENIESLSPGHMLRVRRNGGGLQIEKIRYWDMEFPEEGGHDRPDDEAYHVEKVREELTRAWSSAWRRTCRWGVIYQEVSIPAASSGSRRARCSRR